ncbi:MAG TPA: biotin--[acetyl-CoA-carboxylase] ligase [Ktedonobacterales bacterium]|jgi:BirA family biotin operon repressor/biotin-[acetyl-CoA-carboxylase] ligase
MGMDSARAPLDVAVLEAALAGIALCHPVIYLPVIGSTNTHAVALARAGAVAGTLVIADEQPEGRGRVGRAWRSMARQQVLASVVLRPAFPPHFLVMAAALAVAEAVAAVTGARPDIKWPNDVLWAGRKLCGILIETGSDTAGQPFAVLGIGLNVNGSLADDAELAGRAATLAEIAGHPLAREVVAAALFIALDRYYAALHDKGAAARADLRADWRARLVTLGQRVRLTQSGTVEEGVAEDVDGDGALLLRRDDGTLLTVTWGDVS